MKMLAAMIFCLTSLFAGAADVSFKGVKPAVIIDVRTPQEYAAGHIEGALNIPHDRIAEGIRAVKGLKKDQPVLVYCRSGRRSALARQPCGVMASKSARACGVSRSREKVRVSLWASCMPSGTRLRCFSSS